jgi:hypothetical protein
LKHLVIKRVINHMSFVRKLWRFFLWSSAFFSLLLWMAACIFWVRGFWFYDCVDVHISDSTFGLYSLERFGLRYDFNDPLQPYPLGTPRLAFYSFDVSKFRDRPTHGLFSHDRIEMPSSFGPRPSYIYVVHQWEMSCWLVVLLLAVWPSVFMPRAYWRMKRRRPQGRFPVEIKPA